MADNETEQTEETQEVTEQTEEVQTEQTEQTEETKTEETKGTEKPESKESFVEKWKGKIKDRLSGGDNAEDPGAEIPDEFTEAARKMNMSDEDTAAFAAGFQQNEKGEWIDVGAKPFTDEQLKEMIPSLLGEDTAKADDTSDKTEETQSETKEDKVENSQEDDRLTQALDRITELEKTQGISAEKSEAEEQASFVQRASDLFDEASKEFEVFGKTDDLPKFPDGRFIPTSPQMKARLEVYERAEQLKRAGMPGDEALELSLNAYKGANLSVETKRNVIKDLKKREQTLSGKRVSHEVAATDDLTGPQILQAVARKHGVELQM